MDQTIFAKKILRCTPALWSMVLSGQRNLGFNKAKKASKLLKTNVELWINPGASVKKRIKAWENYKQTGGC